MATCDTQGGIKTCEDAGIEVRGEQPEPRQVAGIFPLERFYYDGTKDLYTCPAGKRLSYRTFDKRRRIEMLLDGSLSPLSAEESMHDGKGPRRIKRPSDRTQPSGACDVAHKPGIPAVTQTASRASLRHHQTADGQDYFLLRGQQQVSGETSLTLLAYNLKRVLKPSSDLNELIEALAMRNANTLFRDLFQFAKGPGR